MAKDYSNLEGLIGNVRESIRNAYDKGYKQGFKEGSYNKEFFCNLNYEHGTNKGLDDAWECARKIALRKDEARNAFHDIAPVKVFEEYSASEAIAKIKEYEEKQKTEDIKVGDEVYIIMENYPSIVTCIFSESGLDNPKAVHITGNGKYAVTPCSQLHKTGRHFDQIAEVLEQLKEEQDETD